MCAATAWLSTLLPSPRGIEDHFGSVSVESKPARVMLPVFFGQADVCLTTRRSFVTMSELNPQVGKRLRTIATSPEVVATLYMFRKGYTGRTRDLLVRAMEDIRSTAAGRQVLTMFQIESLALRDTRCLAGSLEILAQADRIQARRNAKGAGA